MNKDAFHAAVTERTARAVSRSKIEAKFHQLIAQLDPACSLYLESFDLDPASRKKLQRQAEKSIDGLRSIGNAARGMLKK